MFPGCVALVWRDGSPLYHEAHGHLATHPPCEVAFRDSQRDTVYDLASLTKVLCTTTLAAVAVGRGLVSLDAEVPNPYARACPAATLTDLLEHCAGLPAHREYFAREPRPDRDRLLAMVADEQPAYALREKAVYSDLGFMILGTWLERLFDAPLEQAFDDHVAVPLGVGGLWVDSVRFRPIQGGLITEDDAERVAPTEVYDPALHEDAVPSWFGLRRADGDDIAHGQVHDDNAFVMGGVAGHAGLFGTAQGVLSIARGWLENELSELKSGLVQRFWTLSEVQSSTRRLGWDGQSADASGSTGGALCERAVGHTGFTGTSLWLDPERGAIYVLLSNRVHPTRDHDAIKGLRQQFHHIAARL